MAARRLDAIIVFGNSTYGNPPLYYVMGSHAARGAIYVKPRGAAPVVVTSNLDAPSARRGRVRDVRSYSDFGFERLQRAYGPKKAGILLVDRLLHDLRVRGRIGVYGQAEAAGAVSLADALRARGHHILGERPPTLLEDVRRVKDHQEVERIAGIGRRTERVFGAVRDLLQAGKTGGGGSRESKELTLRVGDVKAQLNKGLAEEGLVASEEMIVAAGPASADPHHPGLQDERIPPKAPVVVDIFPQEPGGYWFDTTRTYSVGTPSSEVRRMHATVREALALASDRVVAGERARDLMLLVCQYFEKAGYLTPRQLEQGKRAARTRGLVHSLGHGVGLTIGEPPYLSLYSDDVLEAGEVVTVEPGLYEPGVGGVRLEDVLVVGKRRPRRLSQLPTDLVI
jgi:Xaa-Pro aminopeptidase